MQFSQALLALVSLEFSPVLEVLIKDSKRLLVVARQLYLLPELLGQMGALNRLHVQVALAFLLKHGRVPAIREWAGVS